MPLERFQWGVSKERQILLPLCAASRTPFSYEQTEAAVSGVRSCQWELKKTSLSIQKYFVGFIMCSTPLGKCVRHSWITHTHAALGVDLNNLRGGQSFMTMCTLQWWERYWVLYSIVSILQCRNTVLKVKVCNSKCMWVIVGKYLHQHNYA